MAAPLSKEPKKPALRDRSTRKWSACDAAGNPRAGLCSFHLWRRSLRCTAFRFWTTSRLWFGERYSPQYFAYPNALCPTPDRDRHMGFSESRLPIKRFEIVSEGIVGGALHPGGHLI